MTANGLAETLSSDFESMFSLLQSWDADRDGIVSATDFRLGLQSLGFTVTEDEADCLCRALDKTGDGKIRLAALELATDGTAKTEPPPPAVEASSPDAPHSDALQAAQRALAAAASSPSRPSPLAHSPLSAGSPPPAGMDPTSTNGAPDEAADPFERFLERSGPAATGDTQPLHHSAAPPSQPQAFSPPAEVALPPGTPSAARSRPSSVNKKETLRSFGELSARVRDIGAAGRSFTSYDGDGEPLAARPGSPQRSCSPPPELLSSHLARSGLAFMEGSRLSLAASSCGRRSSLGAAESFTSKDIATLPEKLAALLINNHTRVIDLFRSWDDDEDGAVSREEFARGLRELGIAKKTTESELNELFATLDINGDGTIGYEELHRMLRVGAASRMSEYLRDAAKGSASPPVIEPGVAREKYKGPRAVDEASGAVAVEEEKWPAALRVLLLRERKRVVDLFRHWEGGEDGTISVEHFKAGLYVLGHQVTRSHVAALFRCMGAEGGAEGVRLPFRELRRQLRVAAQRGQSGYLRSAARVGAALEAATPRGGLLSEMDVSAAQLQPDPHTAELAQALGISSPGYSSAAVDLEAAQHLGLSSGAFARSGTDLGGGVVGLGAFASSARDRARAAAEAAAEAAAAPGRQAVHSAEMMMQQWARTHYSSLLTEIRKWELRPGGEVSFDAFADSLVSLGFPTVGKWQEIEAVWHSWEPSEAGTHHWLRLRAHLTGGRMVKVQQKKHTVALYYKQASRAGEGFGNRSSPRFRDPNPTLIGPGKYKPEGVASPASDSRGTKWSGKMSSSAERFRAAKPNAVPGPGRYKPRHTLTDARASLI